MILPVRLFFIFIFLTVYSSAQHLQTRFNLPQVEINRALDQLRQVKKGNTEPESVSRLDGEDSRRSTFSILNKMAELKNTSQRLSFVPNTIQQIDTILVGDVPNDTLVISGTSVHTGPVFVFNDGVLIFNNADFTNVGDVYVFGHGQLIADSSSFFFPQQYFYERSLLAVQNGYIHMEACSLNYGGLSHNLVIADSAMVEMKDVFFNDWTTAGMYGHPILILENVNLGGEYILTDHATTTFKNVETLLLWHHFPDTAVITCSFPPGDSVNNYVFNNSSGGVSGIRYNVQVDSCLDVMWGIMPVNGSDVTISNSVVRAIGAWFQYGDTVSVSGLINNSNYVNFITPLSDRNLHLVNSSVQTWSLYVFDSSKVNITSSILGEVGCQGRAQVISSQFFLDGSGGYFWATDTSFIVASSVSVASSVRSERNGIFLLGYSSLINGTASATGSSVMIVVQSALPQDPVAYDNGIAWFANIAQPSSALVNATVAVTGSSWIDQGPRGSFMDFGTYSLYYQQQGTTSWNALVIDSAVEIRNVAFTNWNTNGLPHGNYFLRLVVKNNLGDSVDAVKNVTLLPSILTLEENDEQGLSLKILPLPVTDMAIFELNLEKSSILKISVFDALGREQKASSTSYYERGVHRLNYDVSLFSEGLYFLRVTTESTELSQKFMILRPNR